MTGLELKEINKDLRYTNLQAASILGVSRQTLYTYLNRVDVPLEIEEKIKTKFEYPYKSVQSNAIQIGELNYNDLESPYIDLGNNQFLMVVPLIPMRASAGYRENYQDDNFINENYEKHYFHVSKQYRGKYFAFIVDGESMDNGTSESIVNGSTVVARDIQRHHWSNKFHLKNFQDYVIVHKDAIFIKRIIAHDTDNGIITCHSLNPDKIKHFDFDLKLDECLQIMNIVNVTQPR